MTMFYLDELDQLEIQENCKNVYLAFQNNFHTLPPNVYFSTTNYEEQSLKHLGFSDDI